jgi:phosphoribosylglycinamide formyltransferase 2
MVTLMSQNLSEFALHARAILGLPIPAIKQLGPTASAVLLVKGQSQQMSFGGLQHALQEPDTEIRLFGKPEVQGERRLGIALAQDVTIEAAMQKALRVVAQVQVEL